jgi:glycosyltransferase involved in cell wall biosynthesis
MNATGIAMNATGIAMNATGIAMNATGIAMNATDTSLRVDQVVMEFSLRGGIEAVAFELQRAFRAVQADCRVVTSLADETAPDVQRIATWVGRIRTRGRMRHVGRALAVPLFTLAATRFLRTSRRDGRVVLSHGDTLAGDICVVHAVNRASLAMKQAAGSRKWMLNPMHHWVSLRDRVMIGGLRFRRYVALSERVIQELQQYYAVPRDRIVLIPNGVNLDRFTAAPVDRAATRAGLGLPAEAPVLLFVGHEFERKGLIHAIGALAALENRDARRVVVGAGRVAPFEQQAQRLGVGSRVLFTGPRNDLPQLYRMADAFVFPTTYESFSLTCMEAMACGLPVFATAVGGIEDYLRDGHNGRIIPGDGAAIAAALRPMLRDPALRQRFRDGALATSAEYGWPRIAARYLSLLDEVRREIAEDALSNTVSRRRPAIIQNPAIAQTSNSVLPPRGSAPCN